MADHRNPNRERDRHDRDRRNNEDRRYQDRNRDRGAERKQRDHRSQESSQDRERRRREEPEYASRKPTNGSSAPDRHRPREDKHRSAEGVNPRDRAERPSREKRDNYTNKNYPPPRDTWENQGPRFSGDERVHYKDNKRNPEVPPVAYVSSEDDPPSYEMEYYEPPPGGGILECNKCRYLCTGRGVLQLLETMLNVLTFICIVAGYVALSGFSSNAGFASNSFSINSFYSPFEGEELKKVRELDQQFSILRAPLLYSGLAVTLGLFGLTLAVCAAGARHLSELSRKLLVMEAIFSGLASMGYAAAVGVYMHFVLQINQTDVCKQREILYFRNGLTWMNCGVSGMDGAAACFGVLLVIFYGASVFLAFRVYRDISGLKERPPIPVSP
ncbi:MARVEL domain-containing protein 3 isoform X1 [Latimeria chalumnae]|uniref:MARVEL domain-containing protein 3 isoform X1 n=1 Tax=Latimeria chalumnae TaxID=7897 RepID=UPI0003C116BB|nr:PREDICTED: MARVEL domain-containing protein 3 isoform X1 [Latimeria chalumnae]|eukprot:XP_006006401.1 PREDICTED: MARVEL domain-containing protein 3 isoform X1 [Latimeria chalumnae]